MLSARPRSLFAALLTALPVATTVALSCPPAHAVVTQVDGTLLPVTNNIVSGLNRGENGAPYKSTAMPANPIDPIGDASETPEIFAVPKAGGVFGEVEFIDLQEGASFENTFGWYNVGDDLSNLGNLHPVITCWDDANAAQPWKGNFEPTTNKLGLKSSAKVSFQTEFTQGRYKGGFIGFYLVSPDGTTPGAINTTSASECPTYKNGDQPFAASPAALYDDRMCPEATAAYCRCGRVEANRANNAQRCVGRIFYTEKLINGDGNYVHYLNYQTRLTQDGARRNDFYFGFEDRYRGNDNDFEDQLLLVKGLDVPCVPQPEICDGKDNNCDGKVDNNTVDSGQDCGDSPSTWGIGKCKPGATACVGAQIQCSGEVLPSAELCNGLDDNCNKQIDDGVTTGTVAAVCPNDAPKGQCTAKVVCIGGSEVCEPGNGPEAERCNGLDDDCDGKVDNAPVDVGQPCGTSAKGVCKLGVYECGACKSGETDCRVCVGAVSPGKEVCNGLDDDCNGLIDDGVLPGVGDACGGGSSSQCKGTGSLVCVNGELTCEGVVGASAEVCDGKDNNCDGKIDNDPVDVGLSCGVVFPPCQPGKTVCKSANGKAIVECEAPASEYPHKETCNGIDDDCDGSIDNLDKGVEGTGDSCSADPAVSVATLQKGVCKPGSLKCVGGAMLCLAGTYPSPEICDGLDNDCDGKADDQAACPASLSCIEGSCRQSCKDTGEFDDCPGGQECKAGVCRVLDCTGQCAKGTACNTKTGVCEKPGASGGSAGGGGSAGKAGGAGKTGGAGGTSPQGGRGGAGGLGAGGKAGAHRGENGESGESGGDDGEQATGGRTIIVAKKNFGLATGGGCSVNDRPEPGPPLALAALLGLAAGLLRRQAGKKVAR